MLQLPPLVYYTELALSDIIQIVVVIRQYPGKITMKVSLQFVEEALVLLNNSYFHLIEYS